jgi:hypothetical protein
MTEVQTQNPIAVVRVPTTRRHMLRRIAMNTYVALVGASR